jgi:hypothetical protein
LDLERLECLELRTLCLQNALAPQPVDRSIARHARDPGARVVREPVDRPAFESDHERLLDSLFGGVEVAEDANQGRDRPPGLMPEQAVDDLWASYEAASAVSCWL